MLIPLINPGNTRKTKERGFAMVMRKRSTSRKVSRRKAKKVNRAPKANPRKKRVNAWYNDYQGHKKAASKGWRKRKASKTVKAVRKNPSHKRRIRKNPNFKALLNKQLLTQAAVIGGGIVGGFMLLPLINSVIPKDKATNESMIPRPWLGLVNVAAGLLLSGFVKNKMAKELGIIVVGTGVYDLISQNLTDLGLPAIPMTSPLLKASASYYPGAALLGYNPQQVAASYEAQDVSLAASYRQGMSGSQDALTAESNNPYLGILD